MKIEWNDGYKIGQDDIDAQHQHLFELTNAVVAAADDDDVPALRKLFMALYQHTREHFELEEALMRKHNFPGTVARTGYHNRLLTRLNALSQDVGQGQVDKPAIEQLMGDWALCHIPQDDALIAAFIAGKA
jgi:hemerythrin